jgi:circadian clock protein KaiB
MSNAIFLLFIAGSNSPKSRRAINNVKKGLKNENCDLIIIDIFENPHIAESAGLIGTPLLMRTTPEPVRRFLGDFTNSKLDILT